MDIIRLINAIIFIGVIVFWIGVAARAGYLYIKDKFFNRANVVIISSNIRETGEYADVPGILGNVDFDWRPGYHLGDNISNEMAIELMAYVLKTEDPVIYISSTGGEVEPAFAIYDFLKSVDKEVTTVALGRVQSAAFMPFIGGDIRLATKNTVFMHHPIRCIGSCNDDEMHVVKMENTMMRRIYAENGLDPVFEKLTYKVADYYTDRGIITGIIKNKKE